MDRQYVFTCPQCKSEIAVDERIREELVAAGCAVCTAAVSLDHFEPRS